MQTGLPALPGNEFFRLGGREEASESEVRDWWLLKSHFAWLSMPKVYGMSSIIPLTGRRTGGDGPWGLFCCLLSGPKLGRRERLGTRLAPFGLPQLGAQLTP